MDDSSADDPPTPASFDASVRSTLEQGAPPSTAEPRVQQDDEAPALPPLRLQPGGELGRGGMGVVTAAFDPVLERTVALKRAHASDPAGEQRLLREAKLAAQFDHPGIVGVLDVGRDGEGRLAAVLPVRAGRSFGEAVAAAPGPRPSRELLRALLAAAQAVAYAHARGVVHRDLSPSNVRLGEEGAVWVIDWGLAATRAEATRGGFKGGTEGFSAPEQRGGDGADVTADVWSLGALLHLACAGAAPAATPAAVPRGVPRPLWAVARKALSPVAAHRYPDAHAFAAELARWLDGQPVEALPEGPLTRLARRARRAPRLAAALVLTVTLVLAVITGAAVLTASARERALRATATLLADSAERALHADDVETARRVAKEVLAIADSPRARGVLAAAARVPQVERRPLPPAPEGCVVADEAGGARLCLEAEGVSVGGRPLRAEQGALLASGRVLGVSRARGVVELWGPDGGLLASEPLGGGAPLVRVSADRTLALVTTPDGVVRVDEALRTLEPCTPGQAVRFAVPRAERLEVLCADDVLVRLDREGRALERRPVLGLSTLLRGALMGDVLDDDTLAIGNAQGQLGLVSLSRAEVVRVAPSGLGLVHTAVAARDGRTVAFGGERGCGLWRVPEGHLLPVSDEPFDDVQADEGGFIVRRGAERWRLSAPRTLAMTTNLHGRAALAVHDGTRRVAVGDSVGTVELLSLDTGSLARAEGLPRVIKSLAFSPSGRWLAVGAAGTDGVLIFDTRGGALRRVPGAWDDNPVLRGRHVIFLEEELLLVYGWAGGPWAAQWSEGSQAFLPVPVPEAPRDARAVARVGAAVYSLDASGVWSAFTRGVERFEVKPVARWEPAPTTAATPAEGSEVVTAAGTRVERQGRKRGFDTSAPVESLALASDGRLAVCRRDGVVELRDSADTLRLEVPAFEGRCGRVAFCDGEQALCAVGWDGRLRVIEAR
jgi:hypothetical protein